MLSLSLSLDTTHCRPRSPQIRPPRGGRRWRRRQGETWRVGVRVARGLLGGRERRSAMPRGVCLSSPSARAFHGPASLGVGACAQGGGTGRQRECGPRVKRVRVQALRDELTKKCRCLARRHTLSPFQHPPLPACNPLPPSRPLALAHSPGVCARACPRQPPYLIPLPTRVGVVVCVGVTPTRTHTRSRARPRPPAKRKRERSRPVIATPSLLLASRCSCV